MSRSIHTTYKAVKGLTKRELEEQSKDPKSDLAILGHKSFIKSEVKKDRKNVKITEDLKNKNGQI
ncbi:hypothetical protein [Kaistella sp.]|uniref:hypothetical protein n=1 Tax=Kaistella sp. TaxID=2782235 RepID=UPI003C6830CE